MPLKGIVVFTHILLKSLSSRIIEEDGLDGWLDTLPLPAKHVSNHAQVPCTQDRVMVGSKDSPLRSAASELQKGSAYLSMLGQGNFKKVERPSNPSAPSPVPHGPIEEDTAAPSIFFDGVKNVKKDLSRVPLFGSPSCVYRNKRCCYNNVNADVRLFNKENRDRSLGLSLNFASPNLTGDLDTFDPLDKRVRIPDMAGYLVKANSEGQAWAYHLQQNFGLTVPTSFVYDKLDWTDWKADRANAAVEFFKELDGKFDDNVRVREAPSPLFAHLRNTNAAIELQISQEYLGQQCHLVYLPPLCEISSIQIFVSMARSPLCETGCLWKVTNVGTDKTWLGSHLSMSNLYAFGRMAWEPTSDPQAILEDWTRLTFDILHTGNLGIQTLTDILYAHYGPNPASQDNKDGVRGPELHAPTSEWTVPSATAQETQVNIPAEVAERYEKPETTPDDLMLWFHHTVIQHFYTFHKTWDSLQGQGRQGPDSSMRCSELKYSSRPLYRVERRYQRILTQLSGIADKKGRAEKMELDGYRPVNVTPTETASKYVAVYTDSTGTASTTLKLPKGTYDIAVNYYDVVKGKATWALYLNNRLIGKWVGDNEERLGHWPSEFLDGHSATRMTFEGVKIKPGDKLVIIGKADGAEKAALDYISVLPQGVVD
ncbi:glycoside hydrolase superfamily [Fusarium tricinctum]|uniref:Glycoside hydrolase superfamily n=1 Tax=Fusarium tricinctum TaxID=61284 RepID=A0A8K0RH67_9HYPO|nr:glycoside hydrolase superfamily [Fusarium tricinctum]